MTSGPTVGVADAGRGGGEPSLGPGRWDLPAEGWAMLGPAGRARGGHCHRPPWEAVAVAAAALLAEAFDFDVALSVAPNGTKTSRSVRFCP